MSKAVIRPVKSARTLTRLLRRTKKHEAHSTNTAMKTFSIVRFCMFLCSASAMVPIAIAQAGGGEPYPRQGPGAPDEATLPEKEVVEPRDLAGAKKLVDAAGYDDKARVIETIEVGIESGQEREKQLSVAGRSLDTALREQVGAAIEVAEAKRELLEEHCMALENSSRSNWESRKRTVGAAIDEYTAALDRVIAVADNPEDLPPPRH
jgi:hypothetical protein